MDDYLYVLCAIVVVLILVVLMYIGSVYVMREKSFESALVEQSSSRRELLEQNSSKHEKKLRKRVKHADKSQAEIVDQAAVGMGTHSTHHSPAKKHVELELKPEVIVLDDIEEKSNPVRKPSSPTKPAKSILLNKEEKVQIAQTLAAPELFHRHTSVDELDLKVERRKSDHNLAVPENENITAAAETVSKVGKKKKSKALAAQEVAETESVTCLLRSGSEPEKLITPTTVSGLLQTAAAAASMSTSTQNSAVDPSVLSESKQAKQLQGLIDKLTIQLSDKEKELVKEKSRVAASSDKITELQKELAGAKHQIEESVMQKRRFDAENEKAASTELSKINEKHSRSMTDLQTNIDMLKSELVKVSKTNLQLVEENRHMKDATQHRSEMAQKVAILEDTLQKSSIAMATNDNAKKHLEAKLCQYEEKISQLSTHLQDVNSQNLGLLKEIQQVNKAKEQLCAKHGSELQHLESCLKESEMTKRKFESQAVTLQCRLMEVERRVMKAVPIEYGTCTHDGAPNTKSDEISSFNGQHQAQLDEKDEENKQLQKLLDEQRQKNQELRQKNYTVLNALSEMEKMAQESVSLKEEYKKKTTELDRLRSELKDLKSKQLKSADKAENGLKNRQSSVKSSEQVVLNGSTTVDGSDQTVYTILGKQVDKATVDEVVRLQTLVDAQTKKNDELRQKNYAVLDALAKVEKVAESSVRLKDQLAQKETEIQLLLANQTQKSNSNADSETCNKLNKLEQQMKQLRQEIQERDMQITKLKHEIDAVKPFPPNIDVSTAQPGEQGFGRKEVTFVTHVQETTSWDMSQMVLDLDTKTAELHILQSLLEQNENALRKEQMERSRVNELVEELRLKIAQKDLLIQQFSKNVTEKGSSNTKDLAELQSSVQHYKTVLRETEGMLSSLQASVEKEESSWRSRIAAVEDELNKERVRAKCLDEKLAEIHTRRQV